LPDTGIRDENGLEPMDHLFSSPEKPKNKSARKAMSMRNDNNKTLTSEEDMDVDGRKSPLAWLHSQRRHTHCHAGTVPEPTAVLDERKRANMRLPPRSKSPIKTYLQSPARRNPSLGPVSSPVRGSIVPLRAASTTAAVRRKLDFSNTSFENEDDTEDTRSPQKRGVASLPPSRQLTNKLDKANLQQPFSSDNGNDNDVDNISHDESRVDNREDSFQMVNGGDDEEMEAAIEDQEDSDEPEVEPTPKPKTAKKGRPKANDKKTTGSIAPVTKGQSKKVVSRAVAVVEEEGEDEQSIEEAEPPEPPKSPKRKVGRPKRAAPMEEPGEERRPTKKGRKSLDTSESVQTSGRSKKSDKAVVPAKGKPGRKPKLASIAEADSPQVQRGPPMPRNNRGLFILRRETPMEGAGFKQTRSGRTSITPLAYWKNERVEYSEDENEDSYGKFVLPRIKEVVRAEEVDQPKRVRAKSKAPKARKRTATAEPDSEPEDFDEVEPWEVEPGIIVGEVRNWDPDDQTGSQTGERSEELAFASAAIVTRDIAGATFRFAKTLNLPFFGSGMVDLPPGAAKKSKNSRKMQMVFFVFYGRVEVTVNDNVFRIGKGGMFQVPRGELLWHFSLQKYLLTCTGNFYSIQNDYDRPARIFFSQGCEWTEPLDEAEDS
jgi:centromere protein C